MTIAWPPTEASTGTYESIPYEVESHDSTFCPEDIVVQVSGGHDTHAHPYEPMRSASGTVVITDRYEHVPDIYYQDQFAELEARCGGSRARVRLRPHKVEAEHVAAMHDAERRTYGEHPAEADFAATAMIVMALKSDGYTAYAPLNLVHIDSVRIRVNSEGARIELRLDRPDGPVLAQAASTGGRPVTQEAVAGQRTPLSGEVALAKLPEDVRENYGRWRRLDLAIDDPGGTHVLYLVVRGAPAEVDRLDFGGQGISER